VARAPNEPLALLLSESRSVERSSEFPWMTRLLDVPARWRPAGYPEVDGSCVIAVDDPLFPENAGPFRIEANGGKVRRHADRRRCPARRSRSGCSARCSPGTSRLATWYGLDGDLATTRRCRCSRRCSPDRRPWSPDFF
jgi:hypothetical protein